MVVMRLNPLFYFISSNYLQINISEVDMSGGTRIYGYIHTINILSTHDYAAATSTHDESATLFYWKGEILEEYWEFTLNEFIRPEYDGKVHSQS